MTVQEFFSKYNGQGLDFDGQYGNQCMDLVQFFNKEVVGGPFLVGPNAVDVWNTYPVDFYDRIPNTPKNYPQLGDIVIWGKKIGQYGHIAVCSVGTVDEFVSFDQNWPLQVDKNGNGTGTAHYQNHNYVGVLGWLRPKNLPQPADNHPLVITADQSDDEKRALQVLKNHFASSTTKEGQPFGNLEGYANTLTQDCYNAWKNHAVITQNIAQPPQVVTTTVLKTVTQPVVFSNPLAKLLFRLASELEGLGQ